MGGAGRARVGGAGVLEVPEGDLIECQVLCWPTTIILPGSSRVSRARGDGPRRGRNVLRRPNDALDFALNRGPSVRVSMPSVSASEGSGGSRPDRASRVARSRKERPPVRPTAYRLARVARIELASWGAGGRRGVGFRHLNSSDLAGAEAEARARRSDVARWRRAFGTVFSDRPAPTPRLGSSPPTALAKIAVVRAGR